MPSEGHQSPPPERQTEEQIGSSKIPGKGIENATDAPQKNKAQLEVGIVIWLPPVTLVSDASKNLGSNPRHTYGQIVEEKFAKPSSKN
jgi:hypothetical protein